LLDVFNFIIGGFNLSGSLQATSGDLEALVKLYLRKLPVYLILDSIDECEDAKDLLSTLLWISNHSTTKVLLFSRTDIAKMNQIIPKSCRLGMDHPSITKDVKVFLSS